MELATAVVGDPCSKGCELGKAVVAEVAPAYGERPKAFIICPCIGSVGQYTGSCGVMPGLRYVESKPCGTVGAAYRHMPGVGTPTPTPAAASAAPTAAPTPTPRFPRTCSRSGLKFGVERRLDERRTLCVRTWAKSLSDWVDCPGRVGQQNSVVQQSNRRRTHPTCTSERRHVSGRAPRGLRLNRTSRRRPTTQPPRCRRTPSLHPFLSFPSLACVRFPNNSELLKRFPKQSTLSHLKRKTTHLLKERKNET